MCNLYSVTKSQTAIREAARAMRDRTGNLPSLPDIFPDQMAPIVRVGADGMREMVMGRWGMAPPASAGLRPVTNIRNTASAQWRPLLSPAHRCIVPFTSFCEYAQLGTRKVPTWFALDATRPVAFFAGLWGEWRGVRGTKANPVEGTHQLFGFLTCAPNREVGAVHPQAMPVILRGAGEIDLWLGATWADASALQRPLPDGALQIVASGEKADGETASSRRNEVEDMPRLL